jgi:carboxylesterase type B
MAFVDNSHRSRPVPCTKVGALATSLNSGMFFDHLDQEPWRWIKADRTVAEEMSSYWVNFAKAGNPNGQDLPRVAGVRQRR